MTYTAPFIHIVEVSPRDGLQNEKSIWTVEERVSFIDTLSLCGFREIEVGSFVSPKWVPQMAFSETVFSTVKKNKDVFYSVLVPNMVAMEKAVALGVQTISIFTAASEAFTQRNINCSIEESFGRFEPVIAMAKEKGIRVRGYLSCVIACPYQGIISPSLVGKFTGRLFELGCDEVSLGDTIGAGTPETITIMLEEVLAYCSAKNLAIHCHDTHQKALENIHVALEKGIEIIDASLLGLGGCPYGGNEAKGNVATESVCEKLSQWGYRTGINKEPLSLAIEKAKDIISNKALAYV